MYRNKEVKYKKSFRYDRLIIVIIILILLIFGVINIKQKIDIANKKIAENKENKNLAVLTESFEVEYVPDINISMAVIGDIMCHNTQYMDASNSGGYDFSYVFEDIKSKIEPADIAIGNLETTFAGRDIGYSSYPTFNTPEQLAVDLKELGMDVLSTCNNHSLDKGYTGIERTIDRLDEAGIQHLGTYKSEEASNEILTMEVKGLKIGFLAYTYGTNGISIPKGKEYCINLIDKEKIVSDLNKAKQMNLDLIVVQMHWGIEYQASPNSEQQDLADLLFQNGADIILGSHPHVLQKMEKRDITLEDGRTKEGFVIYSLGNFVSGQYQPHTKQSVILNLSLTKSGKTGKIKIDSVDYTPIYTYKGNHYRILDINSAIESGIYDQSTLRTELNQVISRVGEPIK